MPPKYKIQVAPVTPRFRPVGKLGIVDWREDCSSCHNCVKKGCVYNCYKDESQALHDDLGYLDYIYHCKGCLNCVQNCTKNLLTRVVNPEYVKLGDDYFTPEVVMTTWFQATTGAIPVSGAGYGGPFSGRGFDAMWTDMSEIVRPTRDGIHGREYISTNVDIGRKLNHLAFEDGRLSVTPPPVQELPLPILLENIPVHWRRGKVLESLVTAAAQTGIKSVVPAEELRHGLQVEANAVIPFVNSLDAEALRGLPKTPLIMIPDGPDSLSASKRVGAGDGEPIVMIRVNATPKATERIVRLSEEGAAVIHLVFDAQGRERSQDEPRHMRGVIREVHGALVQAGTRDEITLVVSGGVALAEHLAKAIICGADLVAIDVPLMLALECRLCHECKRGEPCPIELEEIDKDYAVQRIVNLLGTWHNQLLELMGAMGIREVRRLRGETGRCMFFEDLEAESFGRLFGKRKAAAASR